MNLNLVYVDSLQAPATDFATALTHKFATIDINHVAIDSSGLNRLPLSAAIHPCFDLVNQRMTQQS